LMVRLKKEYLTSVAAQRPKVNGTLFSGDVWYQQDALRSVNQAIGRVIRHKDDYGAIVLADERFRNQLPLLSAWVRQNLMVKEEFGEVYRSLSQFYSQRTQREAVPSGVTSSRSGAGETTPFRIEATSSTAGDSLAPILATKAHEFFEQQRRAEELKEAHKIALDEQERNLMVNPRGPARLEPGHSDAAKADGQGPAKRPSPFTKMKVPQGVSTEEKGANGGTNTPAAPAAGSASDEFCVRVKKLLTPEKYQIFRSCLISISTLKKEVSGSAGAKKDQGPSGSDLVRTGLEKNVQLLKSAFSDCGADVRQRLLEDFAAFLPSAFRPPYAQLVQSGRVSEANLPPGAEVRFDPPSGLKRPREGDA
jgi:regulator of telomere elongation helicase 1